MKVIKPSYYDDFRCIAGACPDSCCKEWDVQVDEQSAEFYRSLPGALGDRLRQVLHDEDGETVMTIVDGRCPMWREDGLCRIQAELGEEALCHVCREFPRLRHDYGDFVELGLELSCPEAAKYILADADGRTVTEEVSGGEAPDYDREAMTFLRDTRPMALKLLAAESEPGMALAKFLLFGYAAQDALDSGEALDFSEESAALTAKECGKPGKLPIFTEFFKELDILTPQWNALLGSSGVPALTRTHLALARYLVNRYWLQTVADYDLTSRVKMIVICCLLVSMLSGDKVQTAQLFSKEIENDVDNLDAILDGVYTCPAFTDDKLLGMCLGL